MPVACRYFQESKHKKQQHESIRICFACVCTSFVYMVTCMNVHVWPCVSMVPVLRQVSLAVLSAQPWLTEQQLLLGSHTSCCHISGHTLTHSVYTLHCSYTSSGISPLSWVTKLTSLNMKIIKGHSRPWFNFFTAVLNYSF